MSQIYLSQHIEDATQCRCDDCGHECPADELDMIADVEQRLTPGYTTPAGQCPECGALAFIVEEEKPATTPNQELVNNLRDIADGDIWFDYSLCPDDNEREHYQAIITDAHTKVHQAADLLEQTSTVVPKQGV